MVRLQYVIVKSRKWMLIYCYAEALVLETEALAHPHVSYCHCIWAWHESVALRQTHFQGKMLFLMRHPRRAGDINVVPSCDWVGSGVDTGTLGLYIHRYKWDWRTSQRKKCNCNSTGTYFVRSQIVRIAKRSHFWARCCRGANALGWVFWRFGSAWATDRIDVVCTVVVSPAPQSAKNLLLQLWLGRECPRARWYESGSDWLLFLQGLLTYLFRKCCKVSFLWIHVW